MDENKVITVRNVDTVGNDRACDPIAITVPVILIEDEFKELQWVTQVMDESTAKQLCELAETSGVLARIIPVQLVLPAADALGAISDDLDAVTAMVVRVQLKTPTSV
jgi:hypothetical protein